MAPDRSEIPCEEHGRRRNSAHAALISNIGDRNRAKSVEHFDNIARTWINEANKYENRFGKIKGLHGRQDFVEDEVFLAR